MTAAEGARGQSLVIGGGVIGVCAALALQRLGRDVAIVDAGNPADGASFGNAGVIAADLIDPLSSGPNLRRAPRLLLHPDGALAIPPTYLPALRPWLTRFIAASMPERVAASRLALSRLNGSALAAWRRLLGPLGLNGEMLDSGFLQVWSAADGFSRATDRAALLERWRIPGQPLTAAELRRLEPNLAHNLTAGLLLPGDAQVRDPNRLVQLLTEAFRQRGGTILRDIVQAIAPGPGDAIHVTGRMTSLCAGEVVVAAGAFSHHLLEPLGLRIPLETERGYHLTIPALKGVLSRPVGSAERHCVVSPLSEGLRIVGFTELGGLSLPPVAKRFDSLRRHLDALLDIEGIAAAEAQSWMGFRPTLPDSLPVIDRHPAMPGLLLAFGHQHLGLTQAATTAEQLARLVTRQPPDFDLEPFRLARFGQSEAPGSAGPVRTGPGS